jgi:hypothetical protein
MSNFLMVIFPYQYKNVWVFDDESVELEKEPFICGAPDIIDVLVENIPDAYAGFKLIFSMNPFPGYQAEFDLEREEYGGYWYQWEKYEKRGWLCPALFKYFDLAPQKIYCKAEPIT